METILVVEDDSDLSQAMQRLLSQQGYRVRAARNGLEALEDLSSDRVRPDLILLDWKMPVMGGGRFLQLRERAPELASIPVLVVTGSADANPSQAVAVLRKPVQPRELFGSVRGALGAAGTAL